MAYIYGATNYCTSADGTANRIYQVRLGYELQSQDLINNTSVIKLQLQARSTNSQYKPYGYSQTSHIDGIDFSSKTFDFRSTNTWQTFATTGNITVNHNPDGSYNVEKSGYFTANVSGARPKRGDATVQVSLPTIPRASSITVNDANIGSATNIVINKASANFTTTLWYKTDSDNDWIKIVDKTSNQVYGWTVPTSFYAKIPNNKTIVCYFKADTYNGDTYIGTSSNVSATFTATGNPIINSVSAEDTNSTTIAQTGDSSKMILYASNVRIRVSASGQNSASISSIKVNGSIVSNGEITFYGATTNTFNIEVIDSRGYPTSRTITMNAVDYVPLTINATIKRNQPTDGKVNINCSGNYFNGSFGNQNNTLTVQYRYKESTSSTWGNWTNLTPTISGNTYSGSTQLTNFEYDKSYNFEIRATDKIGTKTITGITVTKGTPVFWWDNDEFNVNGRLGVSGKTKSLNGYMSNDDVNSVNTQSITDTLMIKKAGSGYGVPNNGVVLEYSAYSGWGGQLYIGDNSSEGLYFNGWSNNTKGTWHRLAQDDWFNDTSGSDWQTMMKNKLDWCISNIIGSGTTYETVINGGWSGRMYGFGLYSRIGTVHQLMWQSADGIYYCRKINNDYLYKYVLWTETTTGSGIVTRTGGATLKSSTWRRYGNVVQLTIVIETTSSTSTGSNAFTGTINNSNLIPKIPINSSSYNGSTALNCYIDENGNISCRVLASNLSSGKEMTIGFTYVI